MSDIRNDLELYLENNITRHLGFETLKFQFDAMGQSSETIVNSQASPKEEDNS